jgi:CCR4-NOT transcription complex subunit 1
LYLVILKALADPRAYGQQWTTKQITRIVLDRLLTQPAQPLPDDQFDILMRSGLINLPLLDSNLAQYIEVNNNPVSLAFSLHFLKLYAPQGLHETDVTSIVNALVKVGKSSQSAQIIHEISLALETLRSHQTHPENSVFIPPQGRSQAVPVDFANHADSDSDFLEKTERLLREWIQVFYSPNHDINKFFTVYVQQMNMHGILKTDDSITRFFQHSTELCVDFCFRLLTQHPSPQNVLETRTKCFHTLDAFAHLILMLVKHSGSSTAESSAKLNLLNKVLNIIAKVALQDQETRGENFQHLPYYRIFIILFMELTLGPNNLGLSLNNMNAASDPLYESIQFQVLSAFCATLRILKPTKCPSFAYAWLDFISHRTFIDKCLNGLSPGASTKGWQLYAQLLIELIKFLAPFLRCVELSSPVDLLYKVSQRRHSLFFSSHPVFQTNRFLFFFASPFRCLIHHHTLTGTTHTLTGHTESPAGSAA